MRLLAILLTCCSLHAGTTYYIDCESGSDSNNGTSTSTPWRHAPGMEGTVYNVGPGAIDIANGSGPLNCGSSPCNRAGDSYIFKGGTTCAADNFKWTIRLTGTGTVVGTSAVYFGVDQAWYAGASWSRPIMDFGGSGGGNKCSPLLQLAPVSYVVIDNLEFTNLYWDSTCSGLPNGSISYVAVPDNATNNEIKNNYFHGWSHAVYGAGANPDGCDLVAHGTSGLNAGGSFHHNVIDGGDTAKDACVGLWGGPPIIYNNFIQWVSSGAIVNYATHFYGNTVQNIVNSYDTTQHMNSLESNIDNGMLVYNNYFDHSSTNTGLTVWLAPLADTTTYFFNNVVKDTKNDNIIDVADPVSGLPGNMVIYNNTVECGPDAGPSGGCFGCPASYQSCTFRNNHLITSGTSITPCGGNCTSNTNLTQTLATANGQGYTAVQMFPFFPTAGGGTIASGVNLSGSCSGGLVPLCSDAAVGVTYNENARTVSAPRRTSVVRGSAWDIGAYQYTPGNRYSGTVRGVAR